MPDNFRFNSLLAEMLPQADQSLWYLPEEALGHCLPKEWLSKTLIRLRRWRICNIVEIVVRRLKWQDEFYNKLSDKYVYWVAYCQKRSAAVYLMLCMLGKYFSRRHFFLNIFFPENRLWHYMQINLHETSKPGFCKKKRKKSKYCLSCLIIPKNGNG